MIKVSFKVDNGNVTYFMENENGVSEISHQEYINSQIKNADELYDNVVHLAKQNGCVWTSWIQRNFKLDWYGASHIIDKMRDEGICGEYDSKFGASRILQTN